MTGKTPIRILAEAVQANIGTEEDLMHGSADVGFGLVTKAADSTLTGIALIDLIQAAPEGYYRTMGPDRWRAGPSYIEIGAWIGDQTTALLLMGLGELVGIWKVVTPKTMGIDDDSRAKELMGGGMVMVIPKGDWPDRPGTETEETNHG